MTRFTIDANPYYLQSYDRYRAIDNATYDGAEDSGIRSHIGHGETPADALRDLIITFLEHPKSYNADDIIAAATHLKEIEQ